MNFSAWARLFRVSNTLTVVADVLAGLTLALGNVSTWYDQAGVGMSQLVLGVSIGCIASVCAYWLGMALNDLVDLKKDRLENRDGALVRGDISPNAAKVAVVCLGVGAITAAAIGGWLLTATLFPAGWMLLLLACIVAYDSPLKDRIFLLGPLLMGSCRALNVFFGASLACGQACWNVTLVAVCIGLGIYVAGFTLVGQKEAAENDPVKMRALGWTISAFGVVMIGISPWWPVTASTQLATPWLLSVLLGVVLYPVAKRVWVSFADRRPKTIGLSIRQAIFGIIGIDAAIAAAYGGPLIGMGIIGLMVPTVWLGSRFRST